jgi:acyl-CoA thioesterase-1
VGGSEKSTTWPGLFEAAYRVEVQDLSHMGETVGSALERITALQPEPDPVILVELGGNDLMGSTSVADFAWDALLENLSGPGRQVLMFELPLPPFRHEFGRVQRRLATKHGVQLVPKRVFLGVIADGGSTLDSVHLTQAGHQRMAETVWGLTRVALAGH